MTWLATLRARDVWPAAAYGAAAGVVAWLVGLFGTAAAAGGRETLDVTTPYQMVIGNQNRLTDLIRAAQRGTFPVPGSPDWLRVAGWQFHRAHFAAVWTDVRVPDFILDNSFRLHVTSPGALAFVVPPVVLAAAGYLVARRAGVGEPTAAMKAGSTVVLGYGVLSAASVPVFAWRASAVVTAGEFSGVVETAVRPNAITAVGLTGIAYPVVFGGLGGFLYVHGESDSESA